MIAASRPRLPARQRNGPLAIDLNVRLSMRTTPTSSSSTRSALQFPLSFVGPRDIRCCLSFLLVSRFDTGTAHLQSISISGPPVRRAARFVAACRFPSRLPARPLERLSCRRSPTSDPIDDDCSAALGVGCPPAPPRPSGSSASPALLLFSGSVAPGPRLELIAV